MSEPHVALCSFQREESFFSFHSQAKVRKDADTSHPTFPLSSVWRSLQTRLQQEPEGVNRNLQQFPCQKSSLIFDRFVKQIGQFLGGEGASEAQGRYKWLSY